MANIASLAGFDRWSSVFFKNIQRDHFSHSLGKIDAVAHFLIHFRLTLGQPNSELSSFAY
jgi:hypothetical protein